MKKIIVSIISAVFVICFCVSCTTNDNKIELSEQEKIFKELNVEYIGGLYAVSEVNDMMLALYKSDEKSVAVITEFGNVDYGEYITQDEKLSDGTEYTQIIINDKKYGYHFEEDLTGFLVDQEGNKYRAKQLSDEVAADMIQVAKPE